MPMNPDDDELATLADPDHSADGESADTTEIEAQAEAATRAQAIIDGLGGKLLTELRRRQGLRTTIEQRWLDDHNQWAGVYTGETAKALAERQYGSRVFVPMTRRICSVVEARWADLLFPTDDRNFVVKPSPEQDLADAERMAQSIDPKTPVRAGNRTATAQAVLDALRELREENEEKAGRMQRAIDDQLQEGNFATHARAAMHDAIKIGTGILKGPYVLGRAKRKRVNIGGLWQTQVIEKFAPTAVRVDPWNYWPDLSTGDLDAMDGHYERHPMTAAQLAELAQRPGFKREAVERICKLTPDVTGMDANRAALREASGTVEAMPINYNLIEFNGSVSHDELKAWGNLDMPEDPLLFYNAVVWFHEASGIVVKCELSMLDAGEQPYSIINWQRDPSCVFGYGLPYEIRDMQEAGNSTFRALLDNMGLSVGGQIVVNNKVIHPQNNKWSFEPNKVWLLKDASTPVQNVFGFFQVASLANELLGIFNTVKGLVDEFGGPLMAMQGSEAPSFMQAGATGMALAYNAANVWMRRAVRAWDDHITVPMISRFINWNMLHNPDDSIKGDLCALARGTSALLEADGYASRIQVLAQLSAQAGVPIRKIVAQLRKIAVAMRLDPEELLPNDAEIKQMEDERAKNGPPPNPELERIKIRELDLKDRQAQREHEATMARESNQLRLAELAQKDGTTVEIARLKYGIDLKREAAKLQHESDMAERDTQQFNAELAARYATGQGI